jgi:hypothetical protein
MQLKSKLILSLALLTVVSVLGYNSWLYSCGACTLHALITPSAPGYLLLAINLLLGMILILLKLRQARRQRQRVCPCGSELLSDWSFCPACGSKRTS